MKLIIGIAVLLGLVASGAAAKAEEQDWPPPAWTEPVAPFRIADTVYYVGTKGIGAYLITGPKGHVLIDAGLAESAPVVASNIAALGFDIADVRYLLISHAHFDHAAGLAELKRLSGARLWASRGDKPALESGHNAGRPELPPFPAVTVDHLVRDGEMLRLGPVRLRALPTPGHTPGCTSWEMRTGGHRYIFACSLTVAGQKLTGDPAYPDAAADFRRSFAKLERRQADIFLTFHAEFFDMKEKRARLAAGDADAFVDPSELPRRVKDAEQAFAREVEAQAAE